MQKIKKLLEKPYILPILIIFTYACLLLDTIKYPGFVEKHFFIDAKVFFVLCLMVVLFIKSNKKILKTINIFNLMVSVVSGLGYIFFSIQEASHYTNYVLSEFHFSLGGLVYVFLFSVSIFAVVQYGSRFNFKLNKTNFWQVVLYFFVAYTLVINFGATFKNALVSDIYVGLHLNDNYDQKMRNQWGNYYDYMVFVRENTPEDATIIVPPQILPWVRTGNVALDRYFLYPRTLVQNTTEQILDTFSLSEGTFIMISWGDWECDYGKCKLWPQQEIKAHEKIIKDSEANSVKEIKYNVIFTPEDTTDPYGLLRI